MASWDDLKEMALSREHPLRDKIMQELYDEADVIFGGVPLVGYLPKSPEPHFRKVA